MKKVDTIVKLLLLVEMLWAFLHVTIWWLVICHRKTSLFWDIFHPLLNSPEFFHEGLLDFVKSLSLINWNDHMISALESIMVNYAYWFTYIKYLHIPEMKSVWQQWIISGCGVEYDLLVFYWKFWSLCLPGRLSYNSLFVVEFSSS